MVGATAHLVADVVPFPLLWVLPLALYLATLGLAFAGGRRPWPPVLGAALRLPVLAATLLVASGANEPVALVVPTHLAGLFGAALLCHARLAADRPDPVGLTRFWLWMGVGGSLGGLASALVAPLVFPTPLEYPLALLATVWLGEALAGYRRAAADSVVAAAFVVAALGLAALGAEGRTLALALGGLLAACALGRPRRLALLLAGVLAVGALAPTEAGRVVHVARSFFGIHRVAVDPSGRYHLLLHGTTLHGMQALEPAARPAPLGYFHRTGPVGELFEAFRAQRPSGAVAVVGLGAGTLACYGEPGERWTVYELDAQVIRIARDPRLFTFLRDCPPRVEVVLGDARRSLQAAPAGAYALLILDAYSGDAPPVHLMTAEALDLYLSRLRPRGWLLFHLTNRHLDLEPVLGRLAAVRGLAARVRSDAPPAGAGRLPSRWLVVAREAGDLGGLATHPAWRATRSDGPLWTDDSAPLLPVLAWGSRSLPSL